MDNFPENIRFKYSWRSYQERVLLELDEHLNDDHLHIIAPPGSGKTILGLEVSLRLNKPTLVLTPTVAIRNQWIQRFCEMFLQQKNAPDWISRDIKSPGFLTVSTYQGLHAACTGEEEIETIGEEEENEPQTQRVINTQEISKKLKKAGIGTIVVDEAHHLKNAWWKSLIQIKNELNPTIVGLTATPPYDVSFQEWQRYLELNGPVDGEITVPELVVEGDLCPHQDYLYLSLPEKLEDEKIQKYKQRVKSVFEEVKHDEILQDALKKQGYFSNPEENLDWIYSNLEHYSSTLIYLNSVGIKINKLHLEIIGDKDVTIPNFDFEWASRLLNFFLYSEDIHFIRIEEHREKWINKLKRTGLLQRKNVSFSYSDKVKSHLATSISKLQSVAAIVKHEYESLNNQLRQVVLTDYIRKEVLDESSALNKIGVLPIFEKIRRENIGVQLGILTGSIVAIPKKSLPRFEEISKSFNVKSISTKPYPHDNEYVIINISSSIKQDIISITTELFEVGGIEVLVGTKSLLGEGWDAPSINSLILASFVGSYVLSNQMRGRAIRAKRNDANKTGNIWHLVCIDPDDAQGGADLELLDRRFKAFVGVSMDDIPGIENGIKRLRVFDNKVTPNDVERINAQMLNKASKRDELKEKWVKALESGKSLIEEIKLPFPETEKDYKSLKSLYFNTTIAYLLAELGMGVSMYFVEMLQAMGRSRIKSWEGLKIFIYISGVIGILMFGKKLYKAFTMYVKYRDISKDIHNIGKATLTSLVKEGSIKTSQSQLKVTCKVGECGDVYCHLEGGTTFEKSTFIQSLEEIITPVDNPRYLIIRKSKLAIVVKQKDYHSVPELLGRKKKFAEHFYTEWKNLVGTCDLVYTRNMEGRKVLLKARMGSLSAKFQQKAERVNKWR